MNEELKKLLLQGTFTIIAALIGAAGVIIAAKYSQELSALKAENSQLEEKISVLTEENSRLRERIAVLENESEVSIYTNTNSTDPDAKFDEAPISQNLNTILRKKAEYTDSDTQQIKSDGVLIWIYEKAGYIYNNLQKLDNPLGLEGKKLDSITVYFLDYETDNIIYTLLSSKNGSVEYYPGNTRKFYCVVISSEYELYVSNPIQALGGDGSRSTTILLDKIGDKYSPLFQVRLGGYDSSKISQGYCMFSGIAVSFYCTDEYSTQGGPHYQVHTTDLGIVEHHWSKSYFSLNTRYVLKVAIKAVDVSSGEETSLPYKTIDGSIKDTNLVDISFEYDGSKISLQ